MVFSSTYPTLAITSSVVEVFDFSGQEWFEQRPRTPPSPPKYQQKGSRDQSLDWTSAIDCLNHVLTLWVDISNTFWGMSTTSKVSLLNQRNLIKFLLKNLRHLTMVQQILRYLTLVQQILRYLTLVQQILKYLTLVKQILRYLILVQQILKYLTLVQQILRYLILVQQILRYLILVQQILRYLILVQPWYNKSWDT